MGSRLTFSSVDEALAEGLARHQAGDLGVAAAIYAAVLDAAPEHVGAAHLLGLVRLQRGEWAAAAPLFAAVCRARPDADAFSAFGAALRQSGRPADAIRAFRNALALAPALGDAWTNLADAMLEHDDPPGPTAAAARRAIRTAPARPEAHFNLGCALLRQGDLPGAASALSAALDRRPAWPMARFRLGMALRLWGRADEAEAAFAATVRLAPDFASAWLALGGVRRERGRAEAAEAALRAAAALRPGDAETWRTLAAARSDIRSADIRSSGIRSSDIRSNGAAVAAGRRAVRCRPVDTEAWFAFADALSGDGRTQEAEAALRTLLTLAPAFAEALTNLGAVQMDLGGLDRAEVLLRRAVAAAPAFATARGNLAMLAHIAGRVRDADGLFRSAVCLDPAATRIWANQAVLQLERRRLAEAVSAGAAAARLDPGHAIGRLAHALALLTLGRFEEGWEAYESRWLRMPPRSFHQPLWRGEPLDGRTVLLHAEQGFGDSIQFLRYVPLVARMGGRVVLEVQKPLLGLARRMGAAAEVVAAGEALPSLDLQCPLLSLPLALGAPFDAIPADVPYLSPDPERAAAWRRRFGRERAREGAPLVGLVWAGNPDFGGPGVNVDRRRSVALADLAPLAGAPGVRFVSLQKGAAAEQARRPPAGMDLLDAADDLGDFDDTAALIAALDLVIGVDTAVIHLAGALGRPVWVLSRFDGCWRWLDGRADSPWYPTLRLYRQDLPGDWPPVIHRIAADLCNLGENP